MQGEHGGLAPGMSEDLKYVLSSLRRRNDQVVDVCKTCPKVRRATSKGLIPNGYNLLLGRRPMVIHSEETGLGLPSA